MGIHAMTCKSEMLKWKEMWKKRNKERKMKQKTEEKEGRKPRSDITLIMAILHVILQFQQTPSPLSCKSGVSDLTGSDVVWRISSRARAWHEWRRINAVEQRFNACMTTGNPLWRHSFACDRAFWGLEFSLLANRHLGLTVFGGVEPWHLRLHPLGGASRQSHCIHALIHMVLYGQFDCKLSIHVQNEHRAVLRKTWY